MTQAEPAPVEAEPEVIDDQYLEIAQSLERGMWIEFEADDGQLAFAKLAWVSPLRGTYLFTNRQGQKALSMTAEELARALPQRPRAPGRGRAADRSRVHQHDDADRREVPGAGGRGRSRPHGGGIRAGLRESARGTAPASWSVRPSAR